MRSRFLKRNIKSLGRIVFTGFQACIISFMSLTNANAQEQKANNFQELNAVDSLVFHKPVDEKFDYRYFIAPTVFIGYGIISLNNSALKELNLSTRYEISEHQPQHIQLDNYTQYAPSLLVYGLNAVGIKGKHDFKSRTILYLTSQLISAAMVLPLKNTIHEERPDYSNKLSFPSGHTATAFSSAEFMFREYKDSNFWLSISGYSFALFTGAYRTLNNRHWVNDVVAGAGIGILSTELAYLTYPTLNKILHRKHTNAMILPYYNHREFGICLAQNF